MTKKKLTANESQRRTKQALENHTCDLAKIAHHLEQMTERSLHGRVPVRPLPKAVINNIRRVT